MSKDSREKRQAGSYSRNAEQDPAQAPATDRDDVPEDERKPKRSQHLSDVQRGRLDAASQNS